MRHLKKGRKLNRTSSHRKALLSNLASSLVINKRIITTHPKAKELQRKYYKEHGTTLRGLMDNHGINPDYWGRGIFNRLIKLVVKKIFTQKDFIPTPCQIFLGLNRQGK